GEVVLSCGALCEPGHLQFACHPQGWAPRQKRTWTRARGPISATFCSRCLTRSRVTGGQGCRSRCWRVGLAPSARTSELLFVVPPSGGLRLHRLKAELRTRGPSNLH